MKKALITLLAILLLIAALWYLLIGKKALRAQHFSPAQLVHCPSHTGIFSSAPDEVTKSLLGQRWSYLGKGRHSCAFGSEDGRFVMKFFRENPRNDQWLVKLVPDIAPLSTWKWKKQRCAMETVIQGYQDAYDLDAEGCGIVYAHLYSGTQDLGEVRLIGQKGEANSVKLDTLAFVIQHKATEFRAILEQHLAKHEMDEAKQSLQKIVTLYHDQYNKGMVDWGIGIMHNSGFVGHQAVHFDVSKLMLDESMKSSLNQRKDFGRQKERIQLWMKQHYPEHLQEIMEYVESLVK
jgi:hypothetical protein